MWNPSTCACECEYLDYKNYVCKNKLIGISGNWY